MANMKTQKSLKALPNGSIMRQAKPWTEIGMSRASWYRHGKPATKPKRETRADLAQSIGVSVRTIYRAVALEPQTPRNRIRRLKQYQEEMALELINRFPKNSDDELGKMIDDHIANLSDDELGKILSGERVYAILSP